MSANVLVERELAEAHAREADYRLRLARHRELASKLRGHASLLRDALRAPGQEFGDTTRLLGNVARLSSQALGIPRTSIWLFDETREHLVCRLQLLAEGETPSDTTSDRPRTGLTIAVADCPAYMAALANTDLQAVAVNDAWRDPRTHELHDYLKTFGVGALLDIPILGPGTLHGVVCHEFVGGPRVWQEEEVDFATTVGAMVALALEAERRIVAEQAVHGTLQRYQQLVETLPVTVYSFQAKTGRLDYLSPKIAEFGGWTPTQLLSEGGTALWLESIEPEDREPVVKRLSGTSAVDVGGELVYRIKLPDGARRWIRDTCVVTRDATGEPLAIHGTFADITALKEAELARNETESRYRTLFENVDLVAAVLSTTGLVEFVNDFFIKLIGFSREEITGSDAFALLVPENERENIRAAFLRGVEQGVIGPRFEARMRIKDGTDRTILWTTSFNRSTTGTVVGVSCLGIDITERVEWEGAQLEEQKLESLGRLATTVAHDFNNLLTIISASTDELNAAPGSDRRSCAEIQLAVEQAASLTTALLAYARREVIAPILLAIDPLVDSSLPMLKRIVSTRLTLSMRTDAPGARVVIVPGQLRQILLNLVANATHATLGFGQEVRVTTNLVVLEADQVKRKGLVVSGTFWVLTVADDGRGMSPALQAQIFEPFFTTKPEGEGTGIGLATCVAIVRGAGGYVSVESQPGQGSTFRVFLPVARNDHAAADATSVESLAPRSSAGAAPVVLVVEDNDAVRNLLTRVLASEGLQVLEAATLKAGRALAQSGGIDVLVSDGNLPDGYGVTLAREMVVRGEGTAIVFIAGEPIAPVEFPVDAVLQKPFRLDDAKTTILKLLKARPR